MKKEYQAPLCTMFTLPAGRLCIGIGSDKTTEGEDGGWSKKFWGLTDDDDDDTKNFAWDE